MGFFTSAQTACQQLFNGCVHARSQCILRNVKTTWHVYQLCVLSHFLLDEKRCAYTLPSRVKIYSTQLRCLLSSIHKCV